jgi:hypothetical protein
METKKNESRNEGKEKLDSLLNQGYLFGENCPIEFAKTLKYKIEEFSMESKTPLEKVRWRAISLGFNLSTRSRIKERELELERIMKKKRTMFRGLKRQ